MTQYAMMIDYGYCTGCKSCEISCRNEKNLPLDEWGIRIVESGPQEIAGEWEWDYIPSLSRACDLCVERIEQGEVAPCQLHCLADVIRIVPVEEVSKKLAEANEHKQVVYIP